MNCINLTLLLSNIVMPNFASMRIKMLIIINNRWLVLKYFDFVINVI